MMMDDIQVNNAEIFAHYVQSSGYKDLWEKLNGWPISHETFKTGEIQKVVFQSNKQMLHVDFEDHGTKRFWASDFANYFSMDELPIKIPNIETIRTYIYSTKMRIWQEEQERMDAERKKEEERGRAEEERKKQEERERLQREKELQAKREFEKLKNKYGIVSETETEPTSPLFAILKKRDAGEKLHDEDVNWLKVNHLNSLIVNYYEWLYQETGDAWHIIKAASLCRKLQKPQKALELTENISVKDPKKQSAVHTSRGGAYKDLEIYDKALEAANKARKLQPGSYYPYNLFGGIYYKLGNPSQGDTYFDKAIELGSSPKIQDHEIRNALNESSEQNKIKTAKYLLEKDPERYHWAKYYLG